MKISDPKNLLAGAFADLESGNVRSDPDADDSSQESAVGPRPAESLPTLAFDVTSSR